MTPREMQNDFEYKVNRYDSELIIESDIIFHWLNVAQDREVKNRYSGNNQKGISFEQNQQITEDLSTLVKEEQLAVTPGPLGTDKPNSSSVILPTDLLYTVGEEVTIQFNDIRGQYVITKRQGITECTSDTYTRRVADPYSEHILHYETAKPLRLFKSNYVELVSDGNYSIPLYHIRYIRIPNAITLSGASCELPEHLHQEIVDRAVTLFLASISDSNYETNKVELNQNN